MLPLLPLVGIDRSEVNLCTILPTPYWWIPAPDSYGALLPQFRTGGFPSDSSSPLLCGIAVPTSHLWIPTPHSLLTQHQGFKVGLVASSVPFLCSIVVPALRRWITTPHSYSHYGPSAALVDFSAPLQCSIAGPAPHWWILTQHSGSAPHWWIPEFFFDIQHRGSSVAVVLFSNPF